MIETLINEYKQAKSFFLLEKEKEVRKRIKYMKKAFNKPLEKIESPTWNAQYSLHWEEEGITLYIAYYGYWKAFSNASENMNQISHYGKFDSAEEAHKNFLVLAETKVREAVESRLLSKYKILELRQKLQNWFFTKPSWGGDVRVTSKDITKLGGVSSTAKASEALAVAARQQDSVWQSAHQNAHTESFLQGKEGSWVVVTYGRDHRGDFPSWELIPEITDMGKFREALNICD